MSLLEINNLHIHYTSEGSVVKAVNGVNLSIGKGERIGIVGETGAGKTTTALGILRLVPDPPGKIVEGDISFEGKSLLTLPEADMRKIRGNKISMIFQDPMTALNPIITVGEQIAEVIRLHNAKMGKAEVNEKAAEMLETVGIQSDRMGEYPHQFSGGMKQRVVIAIALACNPTLLIADEPTTALDVTIQAQVLKLMVELEKQFNTALLMITHDLGVVAEVCDKVAIMYAGEIIEFGTLREIFKNTKHPYTKGLFASIPNLSVKVNRLKPILGLMPDPSDLPSGCPFHPRCTEAIDICKSAQAPLITLSSSHTCKCHLYSGEAAK